MTYEALEVKQDGAIAWLTLNRPHALNALNSTLVAELHDYLDRLGSDRTTRVVIVRGAGRAFCSGLDLKEHSGGRPGDETLGGSTSATLEIQRHISRLVVAIRRLPQPFIAAVRGPASGGGFALALACDVRLAGASARFNAAFIRIGLTGCDMGISYTLPRAVGTSIAYELLLTGRFIDAQRALATRLVSEVVPDAELDAAAAKLAHEMVEDFAARAEPDQGMHQRQYRRGQHRECDRDGGSQPGAMRAQRLSGRRRARFHREAQAALRRPRLARAPRHEPASHGRRAVARELASHGLAFLCASSRLFQVHHRLLSRCPPAAVAGLACRESFTATRSRFRPIRSKFITGDSSRTESRSRISTAYRSSPERIRRSSCFMARFPEAPATGFRRDVPQAGRGRLLRDVLEYYSQAGPARPGERPLPEKGFAAWVNKNFPTWTREIARRNRRARKKSHGRSAIGSL